MTKFDVGSLLQIQTLAFPLVKTFGGPDIPTDYLKPTATKLIEAGATLHQVATILDLAGKALEDGYLDPAEIDAIILQAETAVAAIEELVGRTNGDAIADGSAAVNKPKEEIDSSDGFKPVDP